MTNEPEKSRFLPSSSGVATSSTERGPARGEREREPQVRRSASVTLQALMERAHLAGHPRLPTFVAVHLLQRLCAALEHASVQTDTPLAMHTVSAHFDGTFSVEGSAGPQEDARSLAALFEPLGGGSEDELAQVLAAGLRGEYANPRELAARLGHWAVKQRQVAGSMELGVALLAWLFPEHAPQAPPPELVEYFVAERTTAPTAAPPRVKEAEPERWRMGLLSVAIFVLGTGLLVVLPLEPEPEPVDAPARPLQPVTPAGPPTPKPVTPTPQPAAQPPVDELPRYGHGAPKSFILRPSVHGLDATRAGLAVTAPAPSWSARTSFAKRGEKLPDYAALYAAEFDDAGTWLRLTQVDSGWTALSGKTARFFVVQTDHPPGDGSFDLALATGTEAKRKLGERHRDVFTDVTAQQEGRRYILDSLDPLETYLVTLQKPAAGSGAPVIVSATKPRHRIHDPGPFHTRGPWLQTVLVPGVPVSVTWVSRLSFVALTAPGVPQGDLEVKVERKRDVVVAGTSEALQHYKRGEQAIMTGDYQTAINEFTRCISIDPRSSLCNDLLVQSRRMWELQLK